MNPLSDVIAETIGETDEYPCESDSQARAIVHAIERACRRRQWPSAPIVALAAGTMTHAQAAAELGITRQAIGIGWADIRRQVAERLGDMPGAPKGVGGMAYWSDPGRIYVQPEEGWTSAPSEVTATPMVYGAYGVREVGKARATIGARSAIVPLVMGAPIAAWERGGWHRADGTISPIGRRLGTTGVNAAGKEVPRSWLVGADLWIDSAGQPAAVSLPAAPGRTAEPAEPECHAAQPIYLPAPDRIGTSTRTPIVRVNRIVVRGGTRKDVHSTIRMMARKHMVTGGKGWHYPNGAILLIGDGKPMLVTPHSWHLPAQWVVVPICRPCKPRAKRAETDRPSVVPRKPRWIGGGAIGARAIGLSPFDPAISAGYLRRRVSEV